MWAENLMCYSANCWWKNTLNNIIKRQPYERVGLWSTSSRFPFGLIPDWLHYCLHALLPVHCLSRRCCLTFQHPLCSQASHFIFHLYLSHQKVLSNIPVSFMFSGQSFYLLSVLVLSSIIQHSRVLCVLKPVIPSFVSSCLIRRCYPTFQCPSCSQASHSTFCLFLSHQKMLSNIPVSFVFWSQSSYPWSLPVFRTHFRQQETVICPWQWWCDVIQNCHLPLAMVMWCNTELPLAVVMWCNTELPSALGSGDVM